MSLEGVLRVRRAGPTTSPRPDFTVEYPLTKKDMFVKTKNADASIRMAMIIVTEFFNS